MVQGASWVSPLKRTEDFGDEQHFALLLITASEAAASKRAGPMNRPEECARGGRSENSIGLFGSRGAFVSACGSYNSIYSSALAMTGRAGAGRVATRVRWSLAFALASSMLRA